MGQKVKLRRSAVAGKKPVNSQIELGELSVNTTDGKVFLAKSGSQGPSVEEIIITNTQNTGSIDIVGSVTASFFTGSFVGDGRSLYNIPASGVTGLSLDQIANGSSTASIDNDGFQINTDTSVTGSLTATEFTGSGLGLTNVPFYISGSDVNGVTYGKTFTKLQFDDDTGLNVSESAPDTAFISIGSHYRDLFVNGSEILRATGSDSLEIVAAGGLEISTSLSDTNGNGYTKELKFDITNFSSSIKDQFDIITGSLSASGEGRTATLEVTGATSTWTFNHNLNEKYPAITVFDLDGNVIIPQNIDAVSSTQLVVTFASPQTGVVSATVGGGLPTLGNEGSVLVVSGSVAAWKDGILSSSLFTMPETTGSFGVETLVDNGDGTTTFEVPKTIYEYVKNVSGGPLDKGTPVHVIGVVGFNAEVVMADASDPDRMPATYILNQDLQDQEEGLGIAIGHIQGVDTRGLTAGEPVYVDVGGGWTQTPPTGSALIQNLGILTKIDQNGGGVVLGAGRTNAVPNLLNGQIFYGQGNVATQTSLYDLLSGSIFEHTGSFTGVFMGDGSQLYNIPASGVTGLSLDQIASGGATASISPTELTTNVSILPDRTDTIDLGSPDKQWRDLYLSSGSLYINGQQVLSTTGTELRVTTDAGESIKIIETDSDTITLQTDNGDITLSASGTGNIELDAPIQITAGNKILSSDGNSIVFGNGLVITGSIELNGTVDGVDVASMKDSFDSITGSNDGRLDSLETESGSIRTDFNAFTSSVPFEISGSDILGNTYDKRFTKLQFDDSTGLNVTEPIAGTAFVSLGSHFKDIFIDGQDILRATGSDELEITTEGGIVISTSLTDTNANGYSKELKFSVLDLSSSLDGRLDSLETESGSIRTAFNSYTSSNNTTNTSQNNRLSALETESGSIRSDFNIITGSFDGRLDSLESESGSIRSTFNSYTSSNNTTNTTQNNRLSALETESGSIRSDFNTITGSFDGRLDSLETTSGSHNTRIGNLETFETKVDGGLEFTGSNVTIKGDLLVKGTETRVNSTTVEISDNIISLNGSGAANAGIEVRDVTSPGLLSGSLIWDGTNNHWKGGTKSSEQRLLTVLDTGSLVDRLDSLETTSGSLDGRVDSLETFSGSADSRLDSIESVTGSYITGYTETDTLGTVTARGASTSTAVEFTGGLTTYHTNLNFGVMPDYQQEGTIKITRTDGTDRSHLMKFFNDGTAGNNYIKFALHNGTVSSTTDVLSLFGDGAVNIGGVFQFSTASDLLQINNNTNTGGLNLSGNNSRIYFGGNRAIEGAQDGSNLTLGEGYSTIYLNGNGVVQGTLNTTGDITATSNQPNLYLKESDSTSQGRIVQSGGALYIQSSGTGYTGSGEITFGNQGHTTEYGRFSTSGNLTISGRHFAVQTASNTTPAYSFSGDSDTGLSRIAVNAVGLVAGGSRKFYVNETGAYFQNLISGVTINGAGLRVEGDTTITGSTTAGSFIKTGGAAEEFLMADGTVSTNPGWITSYVDTYLTGATFNTTNGIITFTKNDGNTVTVDIDGKYAESGHNHDSVYVNISGDTMTGNLTIRNATPSIILQDTDTSNPVNQSVRIYNEGLDVNLPDSEGLAVVIDTTDSEGTDLTPSLIVAGNVYTNGGTNKVWHDGNFTSTNITNWNTAYGWGDHSTVGYITGYTETDTLATVTARGATTSDAVTISNTLTLSHSSTSVVFSGNSSGNFTIDNNTGSINFQANGSTVNSMTITSSLITLNENVQANGSIDMGTNTITDTKVGQWDTAYGWGDHGTVGYITGYTETDTLNDVTSRGAIANTAITIKHNGVGLTIQNTSTSGADTGLRIRGARNGQAYANDNLTSYMLFSNSDDNSTPSEYDLAKIGAGMYDADDDTGYFQILTNNGTALTKALDIDKSQHAKFYGNLNINSGELQIGGVRKDGNWDTAYSWGDHSTVGYLTGYTNTYLTGATFSANTLTLTRNDGNDVTVSLNALVDVTVTGGTYNDGTATLRLNKSDGNSIDITGFTIDTNTYITGHTWDDTTGVITSTRNNGTTITVDIDGRYLQLGGGTMSGDLDMGGNDIWSVRSIQLSNQEASSLTAAYQIMADANDSGAPASLGTYTSTNPEGLYFRDNSNTHTYTIYHTGHFSGTHISNWQTAYGWGDHSTVGYLTGYTETQSLQDVTDLGANTTNAIGSDLFRGYTYGENSFLDFDDDNGIGKTNTTTLASVGDINFIIDSNANGTDSFNFISGSTNPQSGTTLATLDGTQLSVNGAITASGKGTFDNLELTSGTQHLTFTESAEDWSILNAQQSNGLILYNGTGGVEIHYNGSSMADFDSGGITLRSSVSATSTLDVAGWATVGSLLVSNTAPYIDLVDTNSFTDANDRFRIRAAANVGQIRWYDASAATDTVLMDFAPDGAISAAGTVTVGSIVKSGGTSSQFLMADGSVSTNPGWITSYTETQTLNDVTTLGNSTSNDITTGQHTISHSVPTLTLNDNGNAGGGGAAGKIVFANTAGNAIGIGYTADDTSSSDLIISTNAGSTYGGYLGLDAGAISDAQADIILDPKTKVQVKGDIDMGTNDITDTKVGNWDTAYGWGNHAGRYMTEGQTLTSINTIVNGGNRYDPSTNNPTNEHYAVLTYGNRGNVTGQLATHFVTGNLYSRGYNSSWSAWRRYWNDTDFTSTNVSNWNTAYTYSTVGHLELGGGTMTGDIDMNTNDVNNIRSLLFTNQEGSTFGTVSGTLMFDENFYNDTEYGSTSIWNGNGGGLAIYNEDGWGRIVTDANMGWLNANFNSVTSDSTLTLNKNTATGISNGAFSVAQSVLGTIHVTNGAGPAANNSNQAAITFQGDSESASQAGIYVTNNNSYGTAMAFAVTESYATGPQIFLSTTANGNVSIPRGTLSVASSVDVGNSTTNWFKNGNAWFGRNHAYDTAEIRGYGQELMIGSQGTEMHINYRTCNSGTANHTPTTWHWRAGSSTSYATHNFGTLGTAHTGTLSTPGTLMRMNAEGFQFGGANSGKEINSAQISAGWHQSNSLNIVGMSSDTSSTNRRVDIWAEAGLYLQGSSLYPATDNTGEIGNATYTWNSGYFTDINIDGYIYHGGDTNTYIRMVGADDMQLVAGGRQMIRMDEGTDPDKLRFVTDSDWTNSSGEWNMSGNVTVGGTLTESSSIRYKEDVVDLEYGLKDILSMRPVTYKKKSTGDIEVGLIAEEIHEIVPEIIRYNEENEVDGLNYSRLTSILVNAIKELNNKVVDLENKLNG